MTEQPTPPADDDDTAGHLRPFSAADEPDDDVAGHMPEDVTRTGAPFIGSPEERPGR